MTLALVFFFIVFELGFLFGVIRVEVTPRRRVVTMKMMLKTRELRPPPKLLEAGTCRLMLVIVMILMVRNVLLGRLKTSGLRRWRQLLTR